MSHRKKCRHDEENEWATATATHTLHNQISTITINYWLHKSMTEPPTNGYPPPLTDTKSDQIRPIETLNPFAIKSDQSICSVWARQWAARCSASPGRASCDRAAHSSRTDRGRCGLAVSQVEPGQTPDSVAAASPLVEIVHGCGWCWPGSQARPAGSEMGLWGQQRHPSISPWTTWLLPACCRSFLCTPIESNWIYLKSSSGAF